MSVLPAIEVRRHSSDHPWTYSGLDLRQRLAAEAICVGASGVLLLSEVAPVITLGRRTPPSDLVMTRKKLKTQGIDVLETDRGGLATYHGPGQWVVFAVDRLERLVGDPSGVRRSVMGHLESALEVARASGVDARIECGERLGVWGKSGKIASVGVRVTGGILLHGMSFNGFRTDQSFCGIRPCGLDAKPEFILNDADVIAFERLGDKLVDAVLSRFWL